jgi:DNA-binding LacI/PurR family transcriptional regulator
MTRRTSSATIRDVAKQAGVSVATVSRYLNQTAGVSPEVAARLDDVMAELKYVPHVTARNLATQKTNAIGLSLTYTAFGNFFAPMLRGIEEVTGEFGFNLLIASRQPSSHGMFPTALGPHNTDGLLIYADSMDNMAMAYFQGIHFPLVLVHRAAPPHLHIPCVTIENKAASRKIVEHLIQVHHRRRIVFLRGPEHQEDSYWREMGYRTALEANGIPYDPELVLPGEFEQEIAYMTTMELIVAGVEFDAIFAGDDDAAVGVMGALKEAGKRVPEDIAVVGFDDQRTAQYLTPSLTTVRAPTEEVGRVAARQLVNLIREGQADPLTLLPTEIVIRHSCGCQLQE